MLQAADPNLDFKTQIRSQDGKIKVRAVKHSCKKAWCPRCGLKSAIRRLAEWVREWDWRYVRQIVLTVDHRLYSSPEEALDTIKGKKHIAALIRNLERTKKIKIIDWVWILEWYKNGYPHWHLFVLVDKAGKAGQIGFKNIVQYWNSGWIKESYIRNEKHWRKITGYFEKHGYFDKKKAHQSRLPEWARNKKSTLRRVGGKAKPTKEGMAERAEIYLEKLEDQENPDKVRIDEVLKAHEIGNWFLDQSEGAEEKTEGEKLDACGATTDLYLDQGAFLYLGNIEIPYDEIRKLPGEYIEGSGYVVELDHNQLNDLIYQIDPKLMEDWLYKFVN